MENLSESIEDLRKMTLLELRALLEREGECGLFEIGPEHLRRSHYLHTQLYTTCTEQKLATT